jgi:hypothetical protein
MSTTLNVKFGRLLVSKCCEGKDNYSLRSLFKSLLFFPLKIVKEFNNLCWLAFNIVARFENLLDSNKPESYLRLSCLTDWMFPISISNLSIPNLSLIVLDI